MENKLKLNDTTKTTTLSPGGIETFELYYNCTKCPSQIGILLLNEDNSTFEFKLINKAHQKESMLLKDFFEKMEKHKTKNINKNICEIHKNNNKFTSFCFDCHINLCDECLKTRKNINHKKINIIEIKHAQEELDIIKEIIKYYNIKIENLKIEKLNKKKELFQNFDNTKLKEKKIIEKKIKILENDKEKEIKLNESEFLNDVNEIYKNYEKLINNRRKNYIKCKNNIVNKYKLMNEKEYIYYNFKIEQLTKKFNDEIKAFKFDELIEKNHYLKKINEVAYNTYNVDNNNYFNSVNINNILLNYIKKEYFQNYVFKKIIKNNYKERMEIIEQKSKEDINYNDIKIEEKNEIEKMKKSYEEQILKITNNNKNEIMRIKEIYKKEIIKIKKEYNNNVKIYENEMNKMKNDYRNIIENMKGQKNNIIQKFQEYLNLLEDKINYVNNEITIIYRINKNDKKIRIFGENFVHNNKNNCKILCDGNEYEITEYFDVSKINKNQNKLEIKLRIINNLVNFSYMFSRCSSLLYLPDISKFNTFNINNMIDMFYGCSSLLFLPDISQWNTSKVENMAEMFDGCSSLLFLPDISKWNTSNVTRLSYMFKNCSTLINFPDISNWNINKVKERKDMFEGCNESLKIPKEFK